MKTPVWLPRAVVMAAHEELLVRFGGSAEVRDEGLLESALSRPENLHAYEGAYLYALAGSYALCIVKNHPFVDGNKRTGFMSAYIFLEANGLRFQAPETEVVERTLALAAGAIGEAEYADWLKRSCGGG